MRAPRDGASCASTSGPSSSTASTRSCCSSRSRSRRSSRSSTCRSTALRERLADRRLTLELTEPARELIAREGYDPVYGARPLRRFIQREVETRIGRALLSGEILDGATITLDAEGDELVVSWRNPETGDETAAEPVGVAA